MSAAVKLALWASLMVAAAGVWLWSGQPGAGLVVAGVASAAVLFFLVDTPDDPPPPRDRSDRRTPGL